MGLLDWWRKRRLSKPVPKGSDPASSSRLGVPPARSAPPPRRQHKLTWVEPSHPITVHGFVIPEGMVYVGSEPQVHTVGDEPSSIDPSLPVRRGGTVAELPYWPSYRGMTPAQRATYLEWLATGRENPSIEIGYVFLFMYGLERRVFVDRASAVDEVSAELPRIFTEMKRLLELYRDTSGSFAGYATAFLDVLQILLAERGMRLAPEPPTLTDARWNVPGSLRLGLGQRAARGVPIPADWALAWVWFQPTTRPRTPVTRCPDEFRRLFVLRYGEKYGDGLTLRPGKSRLDLDYRAAQASIGAVPVVANDVPDVFEQKVPVRKLAALFQSVTDELDGYSRWVGRNPEKVGTLPALARLPPELLETRSGELRVLNEWAASYLRRRNPIQVPGAELMRFWTKTPHGKLPKSDAASLAQLLHALGVGIEPDVRFDGDTLSADRPVVLFRLDTSAPNTSTSAYGAAMTIVHLAAAVAVADGQVAQHEIAQLGSHIASTLHVAPAEEARLFAHLEWLSSADVRLTGLAKRIDALSQAQRRDIGDVVITVAAADNVIAPEEVATLEKIYKLLGLDPGAVARHLHQSLTTEPSPASDGLVPVRTAGADEAGYPIPPRPPDPPAQTSPPVPGLRLDDEAIDRIQGETAAVSALLNDLFRDEETHDAQPRPVPGDAPETTSPVIGNCELPAGGSDGIIGSLDIAHSRFLRELSTRDQWDWTDFEALAATYRVMPGGALDLINEAALDLVDEPVLEGDEVITVDRHTMQELLS